MDMLSLALRSPLLPAILANPADDVARLAHADWLDEQGEVNWSTFIRDQMAVDNMTSEWCECTNKHPNCSVCRPYAFLANHACSLCPKHMWKACHLPHQQTFGHSTIRVWWQKGFIITIGLKIGTWLNIGSDLLRVHPIQQVILHGKSPVIATVGFDNPVEMFGWHRGGQWGKPTNIPLSIFREFRQDFFDNTAFFLSHMEALDALSAACLSWGRNKCRSMS